MNRFVYLPDLSLLVGAGFCAIKFGMESGILLLCLLAVLLLYRILHKLYIIRQSLVALDTILPLLQTIIGKKPGQQ